MRRLLNIQVHAQTYYQLLVFRLILLPGLQVRMYPSNLLSYELLPLSKLKQAVLVKA